MKIKIMIFSLLMYSLLTPNLDDISFAQNPKLREITSLDDLERLITSTSYDDRYFAAVNIRSIPDLDVKRAAGILVEGIILETDQPSTLDFHPRSYITDSERLIRMMIFSLADLGPSINELLHSYSKSLSGDVADWMIVALGHQKDESVHGDLGKIMLSNHDPNLRSMAARALYEFADSTDIPLLTEALKDDYYVALPKNKENLPEDELTIWYPVREDAASALRRLGYFVRFERHDVILKEPGEWEKNQPEKR
jgi:HEAT repeat protein